MENPAMNEKMQELIIKEMGVICVIALIGTITITCLFPDNEMAITLLFGAVTAIITGLFTFLNTKNMSEKEAEILEQNILNNNGAVEDVQ
jgi:hypothetical protein